MFFNRKAVQSLFVLCLIGLVAATIGCGCSSVEPTDRWTDTTGAVRGTVRSSESQPLSDVEVWLWTELPFDGGDIRYETCTDEGGYYEFPEVDMATSHSFEQEYEICANRTPERASSSDTDYGTFLSTVTVERDGECAVSIVLEAFDIDPDDPESYIDD
jgi:hypothetical protein